MTAVERTDRRPPRAWTKENEARFLDVLRQGWSATKAAEAVGLTRSMLYRRRAEDEEFAVMWADAREEGIDVLVDEALRRAVTGVERPVFGKGGVIVGTVTEYSDRLMEVLLRGLRPETFGASAKLTINGGWEPPDLSSGPTLGELAAFLRKIGVGEPAAETSALPQLTAGVLPAEEAT